MTREVIERGVLKVLSTVLRQPCTSISRIDRTHTHAWDSLKHVEIMFAIEEEFGIEFAEQELKTATSASRIVELVEARHAS